MRAPQERSRRRNKIIPIKIIPQPHSERVISWKHFTVCLRVQWKPSEEWKPFFQLNNETVVQLKTCSGWLHSHTTSTDTDTNAQSRQWTLWLSSSFTSATNVGFPQIHSEDFIQYESITKSSSQLWAAGLTSAMWPRCNAWSCLQASVTPNMLVWTCLYCPFMFSHIRVALQLSNNSHHTAMVHLLSCHISSATYECFFLYFCKFSPSFNPVGCLFGPKKN